jgi:molybdopterin/thiamine biosynthesis adenylyltransferase
MSSKKKHIIVRMAAPEFDQLTTLLFSRYPLDEWAAFARFGWRETQQALILTLTSIDPPSAGELDDSVGHVKITEPYSLRMALQAETHSLGVGVVHSHPLDCRPNPSTIDDDMDGYYAEYFGDFAKDRPYVSLIISKMGDHLSLSGRVFWRNSWLSVDRFAVERTPVETWREGTITGLRKDPLKERAARFSAAFGEEASIRLREASVAVIGAGGTGSMAIEVLARAGVGRIIVIDPDHISESNLERVHGSYSEHVQRHASKVAIAREHVLSINSKCSVEAYLGALPQKEIIDAVVSADVALGCTDQQHSRLSLSDISFRYLVPSIDCGVMLEGADGAVTGQVLQLVRFLSFDPCALCRGMINPTRVAEELMSEDERELRRAEAEAARERGEDPGPYWHGIPQLNTVGYLTGVAGAMAAAYAIGWITGRFDPPFSKTQMNLVAPCFDVTDLPPQARDFCACRRVRGWADQGGADALISAPEHWPPVKVLSSS